MKLLLILLLVALLWFIWRVWRSPAAIAFSRDILVSAPIAQVHPYIADLHHYQAWQPWTGSDPGAQHQFSDPASGVGAYMTWQGAKVGSGRMTCEALDAQRSLWRLDFGPPMPGTAHAEFILTPQNDQTLVTWRFFGPQSLKGRIFGVLFGFERMMDRMFTQGLQKLKTLAEKA